jgi:hypothetical protein
MLIDWQRAKRLALIESTYCAFCELGFLRTGDAELLHPKLQRWTLYSKLRSCSVRAREDPVALLKDRQNVPSLDLFQSRSSIYVTVWAGRF